MHITAQWPVQIKSRLKASIKQHHYNSTMAKRAQKFNLASYGYESPKSFNSKTTTMALKNKQT